MENNENCNKFNDLFNVDKTINQFISFWVYKMWDNR